MLENIRPSNNSVTLNNLALALALTDPSTLPRAEQLIGKAIAIDPYNPEYYDTQGEILSIAKRPLDALESLEKAIGLDRNRPHTRELMIKAYRAAGLESLAVVQEKVLQEIKGLQAAPPTGTPLK